MKWKRSKQRHIFDIDVSVDVFFQYTAWTICKDAQPSWNWTASENTEVMHEHVARWESVVRKVKILQWYTHKSNCKWKRWGDVHECMCTFKWYESMLQENTKWRKPKHVQWHMQHDVWRAACGVLKLLSTQLWRFKVRRWFNVDDGRCVARIIEHAWKGSEALTIKMWIMVKETWSGESKKTYSAVMLGVL